MVKTSKGNAMFRKTLIISTALFILGFTIIAVSVKTHMDMKPLPLSLSHVTGMVKKPRLLDRHGTALTTTYTSTWNIHDQKALYEIPDFLQQAFLFSEDKRFHHHGGVDWLARFHALYQNIRAGRALRGASTITEQVVRLIHPRPRTLWSRWIEGFEAQELEKNNSKSNIFWFYLNQVPYASHRRGIAQAARFYFDRDVETLDIRENLALAVLVRAPDYYDLNRHPGRIQPPLAALAMEMEKQGDLTATQLQAINATPFQLKHPALSVNAPHFVRFVLNHFGAWNHSNPEKVHTTLDGTLQQRVQTLLDTALASHRDRGVLNGAALVVDHGTGEILAWAVGSGENSNPGSGSPNPNSNKKRPGSTTASPQKGEEPSASGHGRTINAVTALRQPGSATKPFVYALALEKGWTAATLIQDTPLAERVGMGMHAYRNYSGQHYGAVTLRNALGNSLNIPAVRTIQFVGVDACLARLRQLGFTTLNQHPDFYGDGLALGNGEVSLYELVQAYTVLANQGRLIPLRTVSGQPMAHTRQLFSREVTSLMGHMLSDAGARTLEFGGGGLLNFPVQTAVKTGTSSDYRDAWAMGYNCNFTVGVWMGNLDGSPTRGMTGSRGPAFVLRSIFARLNQMRETRPLYMSPRLIQREVAIENLPERFLAEESPHRWVRTEWFIPGTEPPPATTMAVEETLGADASIQIAERAFGFIQPVNGVHLAMDPRIPDDHEVMAFQVAGVSPGDHLTWYLDGRPLAVSGSQFNWRISRGRHLLEVEVTHPERPGALTDRVGFLVK